ncbi:MAG: hypothetical protein R3F61_08800 [Myxococcota bacterium]
MVGQNLAAALSGVSAERLAVLREARRVATLPPRGAKQLLDGMSLVGGRASIVLTPAIRPPPLVLVAAGLLGGLVGGGIGLGGLVMAVMEEVFHVPNAELPMGAILVITTVVGGGPLSALVGWLFGRQVRRTLVDIGPDEVQVEEETLFETRRWSAATAAVTGVRSDGSALVFESAQGHETRGLGRSEKTVRELALELDRLVRLAQAP